MRFVTQNLILIAARTHFVLSKVMSQYVAFTAVHCELLLFTAQSLLYICRTLSFWYRCFVIQDLIVEIPSVLTRFMLSAQTIAVMKAEQTALCVRLPFEYFHLKLYVPVGQAVLSFESQFMYVCDNSSHTYIGEDAVCRL